MGNLLYVFAVILIISLGNRLFGLQRRWIDSRSTYYRSCCSHTSFNQRRKNNLIQRSVWILKTNTMKKTILYTFTALLAFTFVPNESKATDFSHKTEFAKRFNFNESIIAIRLDEINSMTIWIKSQSEKRIAKRSSLNW